MRKIISIITAVLMVLALTACGNSSPGTTDGENKPENEVINQGGKDHASKTGIIRSAEDRSRRRLRCCAREYGDPVGFHDTDRSGADPEGSFQTLLSAGIRAGGRDLGTVYVSLL